MAVFDKSNGRGNFSNEIISNVNVKISGNGAKPVEGRVLVMDDDPYTVRLFSKVLRKINFSVDEALSIDQAREHIRATSYDVFLCDVYMGYEKGPDLVKRMQTELSKTKVVLVSAYSQTREEMKGLRIECFLEKPVSIARLQQVVSQLAMEN